MRAGKVFTLLISNGDMNDNIKIVKSLENLCLLINGATEPVKWSKKGGFPGAMMTYVAASLLVPWVSSLIQPVAFSLINTITGKGLTRAEKGQKGRFLLLLALPLMMKDLWKGVIRPGKQYNITYNMNN